MAMDDSSKINPGGRLVVPASALLSNDTDVEDEPLTVIEVLQRRQWEGHP